MYKKIRHIHLIGVGGIGMSGIAQLLTQNGYHVTGSDLKRGDIVQLLEKKGVKIFSGHHAENVQGAELIVHSSAVDESNPEISTAREKGIPIIPRAEMLAELMRLKHGIAVAGAHGKTTTTSMLGTVLMSAGLDPTIVVGGRMDNFGGTNARLGRGEFMVVEADESDGSFNKLSPAISVVTNMDREHMDHYKTMAKLKDAFLSFMNKVPFYGLSIYCGDDPYLRSLGKKVSRRTLTYGFKKDNHYVLSNYISSPLQTQFDVTDGERCETVILNMPGRHNALNAAASLMVADELGVPRSLILEGLRSFQGVQRRFQLRGELRGVKFYDDYAHHPMEIAATMSAAREKFPDSKIRAIFQPHRYSRVEDLFDQFGACFQSCDEVYITDIYAAGEKPIPGVDSNSLVETIRRMGKNEVHHLAMGPEAIKTCFDKSEQGDVIFTLGAGDLPNVYQEMF